MIDVIRRIFDRLLEAVAVLMIVAVTAIVVAGFVYREIGLSLVWYDEVASISLAWLTYYGGALAALRGAHIGFAGFINSLPANWRIAMTLTASAITIAFFTLLGVMGFEVMQVIAGITLVSVPAISQRWVASVIPISSALFVLAEIVRLPGLLAEARRGPLAEPEVTAALEHGKTAAAAKEPVR
jgi:TRAP-type C4-dicarboxylate transport system permease small subunit